MTSGPNAIIKGGYGATKTAHRRLLSVDAGRTCGLIAN